jgi:hypothetical protein
MPRSARNISRVPGANVTSKPDCDDISRGKGREHDNDLRARPELARNWSEESTRLNSVIRFVGFAANRCGLPGGQLRCGNNYSRLLARSFESVAALACAERNLRT